MLTWNIQRSTQLLRNGSENFLYDLELHISIRPNNFVSFGILNHINNKRWLRNAHLN